jgi:large subunit ribosomal protein L10
MPTQEKIEEVALLKEVFQKAASLVLADYRGLTATEMVILREKFTKQGMEYRVVKDTLARIAANDAGLAQEFGDLFSGPIAIAVGYDDPVLVFKLSEDCRKEYTPNYELKGGLFEGAFVEENEVKRYATLLSREELLAKIAMLLQSPMRALAVMLNGKIRELAILLGEVKKQREQQDKEEQ